LPGDEVHVWRSALDLETSYLLKLQQTLATDERARADRFKFRSDRERFMAGRGVLRTILSSYLDRKPSELRVGYGPYGKPELVAEGPDEPLSFNVSHSDGLALYAVTRGRRIGIDVEGLRRDLANEQIAERFFSPGEVQMLRSLPGDQRTEAFFACWTRKEAYLKARGEGLAFRLDHFDVSLAPGRPAALLRVEGALEEPLRWSLRELSPAPGYVAAVAVDGDGYRLKCWQFRGEAD
jgi:4'-phosphopantetheinyl transferase